MVNELTNLVEEKEEMKISDLPGIGPAAIEKLEAVVEEQKTKLAEAKLHFECQNE